MTACESSVRTIALRAPSGAPPSVWSPSATSHDHAEEEEGEMFPQARQVFDKEELQALGEQMAARKEQALHDPSLAAQSQ